MSSISPIIKALKSNIRNFIYNSNCLLAAKPRGLCLARLIVNKIVYKKFSYFITKGEYKVFNELL